MYMFLKRLQGVWDNEIHLRNLEESLAEIPHALEREIKIAEFYHQENLSHLRMNAATLTIEIQNEIECLKLKMEMNKNVK